MTCSSWEELFVDLFAKKISCERKSNDLLLMNNEERSNDKLMIIKSPSDSADFEHLFQGTVPIPMPLPVCWDGAILHKQLCAGTPIKSSTSLMVCLYHSRAC